MAIPLQLAIQNLNSDESDEDDDDYVPSGGEESEDDEVGLVTEEAELALENSSNPVKGKRKAKSQKTPKSRKRKGGIRLSDNEDHEEDEKITNEDGEEEEQTAVPIIKDDKAKADSLWADFLSDVPPPAQKSKPKPNAVTPKDPSPQVSPVGVTKITPKPEKITITKVFDFAGESVVVNEEVDANSKAAKEFAQLKDQSPSKPSQSTSSSPKTPLSGKKPAGLSAVLGQVMDKKSKLSTLEKSKLDWNTFKREEGVEEELEGYKKGKGGYLERQAFLQRADLRQFEIEKQLRTVNRSHRI